MEVSSMIYRFGNFKGMKNIRLLPIPVFLLLFFAAQMVNPSESAADNMHGIYTLPSEGKGIDASAAKAPFVTGYSIRVSWKALEPGKGQYNWQPIDEILDLARKNGKYVTLRVLAGVQSPKWIMDSPDIPQLKLINRNPNQTKYFNKSVILPKIWDNNYLREYYLFLEVLAKRYSNEPLLYWVAVSGPVTGAACPMLHKDPETMRELEAQGFTREKWSKVWEEAIDRTAQSFPTKSISLCIDVPVFYPELADHLAAYAVNKYGQRMCLQSNGLSAKVFTAAERKQEIGHFLNVFAKYKNKATIGFQMTWAAAWKNKGRDRLGPLDKAIENGIKLGASYLEIYQDDIIDPANAGVLSNAAKRFGVATRPAEKEGIASQSEKSAPSPPVGTEKKSKKNLKDILSQLDLTKQQEQQVRDIMRQAREKRKAGEKEDWQELAGQIRGVLTEEQKKKFNDLVSR
jgi:Spy/CpxP family protein refolding chaperone